MIGIDRTGALWLVRAAAARTSGALHAVAGFLEGRLDLRPDSPAIAEHAWNATWAREVTHGDLLAFEDDGVMRAYQVRDVKTGEAQVGLGLFGIGGGPVQTVTLLLEDVDRPAHSTATTVRADEALSVADRDLTPDVAAAVDAPDGVAP